MAKVRIFIENTSRISIDVDERTGVSIAVRSRRFSSKIDDDLGVYASRNPTARQAPSGSRTLPSPRPVTAKMEAAGVRAFLAGADTAKLGRALADVFEAMEAVDFDYDEDRG